MSIIIFIISTNKNKLFYQIYGKLKIKLHIALHIVFTFWKAKALTSVKYNLKVLWSKFFFQIRYFLCRPMYINFIGAFPCIVWVSLLLLSPSHTSPDRATDGAGWAVPGDPWWSLAIP